MKGDVSLVEMSPNIYVTSNGVPQDALDVLKQAGNVKIYEGSGAVPRDLILKEIPGVDGLFCTVIQKIDGELIRKADRLKIISNMSIDFYNVDVPEATKKGIMVTHAPISVAETVADATFALLLAVARRIPEADQYVREGKWNVGWQPLMIAGRNVHGKTLGIYGLGQIGTAVAIRGKGFGMNVIYYSRTRKPILEQEHGFEYRSFDELLKQSDFLVVLVPTWPEEFEERFGITPENVDQLLPKYLSEHKEVRWTDTRKSIGERELALMKKTSYIINTGRGQVVDEAALIRALQEKRLAGAGLDVYEKEPITNDNPLLKMRNVVLTPHNGGSTVETRTEMALRAANNLVAGLRGDVLSDLVNPELLKQIGKRT